ncbi:lipase chaperone [Deinococcus apachensis]|uniref:lipase chaperone n=1 Tax=Deinococcus apachensis TaxID=309886 RepID=UPI00047691E7|nr:lipase chaperone [Deinococcus apachensis]
MSRPVATRPKLKVSREMRVLLILLLMVALIAAWAIWSSNRSAQQALAQTTPTPPTGDAATGEGTGPTPTPSTAPADGDSVAVQPGGAVDVPSLPAFGETGTDDTGTAEAEPAPTPGGINPDTALATLSGVNPFRPLAVDQDASVPAGQVNSAPQVTESSVSTPPVRITPPATTPVTTTVTTSPEPDNTSGGVIPVAPIPGTPSRVTVDTPAVAGGAFPTPTLPGATPSQPKPESVTVLRPPSARPTPVTLPRPSGGTPTAPRPPATPTPIRPPATPAPVRPPVTAVHVPKESIDLSSVVGRGTGSTGTAASASGTPDGAKGTASTSATALPTPGTPQPITQLGADATAVPVSALDQLLQSREIALNAAVLGPVNTAVFRSRDGFVVVEIGEKLPDSEAVLKDVTADSATLSLGNDTKTLQLNER